MTEYKTRTGVVLTEIAGEYVLVAAKALLSECPYVTQLNETSAFLWRQLEHGTTLENMESAVAKEYEIENPEEARIAIEIYLKQMMELHYLKTEETEEPK